MDADEALDRIGVIVGWGDNPDPDDPYDAVSAVVRVIYEYVSG